MLALLVATATAAAPASAPAFTEAEGKKLGTLCSEQKKKCPELVKLTTAGCQASNAQACLQLGGALGARDLPGVKQDPAGSRAAFEKACTYGSNAGCLLVVAELITELKFDEAYALVQKTCDRGSEDACRQVPSTFRLTRAGEITGDPAQLERQCKDPRNADEACWQLGRIQLRERKWAAATQNIDRACRARSSDACRQLFQMYADGDAGLPYDLQKAKAYQELMFAAEGPNPFLLLLRRDGGVAD